MGRSSLIILFILISGCASTPYKEVTYFDYREHNGETTVFKTTYKARGNKVEAETRVVEPVQGRIAIILTQEHIQNQELKSIAQSLNEINTREEQKNWKE